MTQFGQHMFHSGPRQPQVMSPTDTDERTAYQILDDLLRAQRAQQQRQEQELLPHRSFPAGMPYNVYVPPGAVQMSPYQHPQQQLALQSYPVAQTPPMQHYPMQQ